MPATEYDFSLTRNEMIEESFRKCGVLADGQNITAGQLDTADKKLNAILKKWSADGIALWTYLTDSLPTVAGTASYSLVTTNGMHYVDRVYLVDNGSDVRLERLSLHDYEDLEKKADQSKPSAFSFRPSEGKIYLYPVPNAVWTLKLWGIRRLKDWETSSSTGELPAQWLMAAKYALAVELAEDYKMPVTELKYLRGVADYEYRLARGKEANVSDYPCVEGAY